MVEIKIVETRKIIMKIVIVIVEVPQVIMTIIKTMSVCKILLVIGAVQRAHKSTV